VLCQVSSDALGGRMVASWFPICILASGASDAKNAQKAG